MADEWQETSLGSLCDAGLAELQTGPFGSQLHAHDYLNDGVAVVPTEAIRDRRIDHSVLPRVSLTKAAELSRHRLRPGDILFARRGVQATGNAAIVKPPEDGFLCGTGAIRLRLKAQNEEVSPEYLSHVLADPSSIAWFKFHAIGATMPNLNEGIIRAFPLRIPPMRDQLVIAAVLGSLDDKIELNRRMRATLESVSQTIFRAWFVDFVPVRAKPKGSQPSLPNHIAALFPGRLTKTEFGFVPEGWKLESLGRHIAVTKGVSYQGEGLGAQGVPLHNLNSILEGGGYKYEGIKYYSGEYRPRHIVRPGDVIVANTEQGHDRLLIGYAAMVPKLFGDFGIASHHVFRVTIKPGSPFRPAFLYAMLNSRRMHDVVSGYANGTTVNMLPEDGLQMPLAVVPPPALIEAFDTLARSSEQRREEMVAESRTLAAMRDALLPKLISGELRVRDPDNFLDRLRA